MTTLKLSEAKAHLGRYARQASKGDVFIIADRNRPVAQLGPANDSTHLGVCPKIGLLKNQCSIAEDFDAPLPEFEQDYYGE